jgi:hypothetical protein
MIETLRKILEGALERLHYHVTTYLPATLAAITLILGAWVLAILVRWLLYRIFKGLAMDRFLRQSGLAFMIDRSGRLRATRLVAESAFWIILLTGLLVGLNVFNTDLTTQIIQGFVFMIPKLVVAGLILLGGIWLSQYLGRSMLVWAVNEEFPHPRRLAAIVRIMIVFVAIVVAAYQLDFARPIFLAAFILVAGGAVFTVSMSIVLGLRGDLRRLWKEKPSGEAGSSEERSLWSHL